MANQTKFIVQGNSSLLLDTEVTQNGLYPVEGKGVYAFVTAKVSEASQTLSQQIAAKTAANIQALTGETVSVESFNALLAALKAAGLMVADAEESTEE